MRQEASGQRSMRAAIVQDGRCATGGDNVRLFRFAAFAPCPHAVILRHAFDPPDNARLAHLCGALDEHLRSIEAALGVTHVAPRTSAFASKASARRPKRALALLQTPVRRARRSRSRPRRCSWRWCRRAPAMAAPAHAGGRRRRRAIVLHTRRADLAGRTPNQLQYLRHMLTHDISFGIGPAGTGKTFLAVACAVDALERSSVQRIVLTRPAVEAGERLGFLPGDLAQKVDPYLRPLYDALYDLMGLERVTKAFEKGLIEIAPLAFMRGRTLNHAFVILDEAQNTTREQMKMFLTRIGFGCALRGHRRRQPDRPAEGPHQRPGRGRRRCCAGSTASPSRASPRPTWCATRWWRASSRPTTRRARARAKQPEAHEPLPRRCSLSLQFADARAPRAAAAAPRGALDARGAAQRRRRSRCASSAKTKAGR